MAKLLDLGPAPGSGSSKEEMEASARRAALERKKKIAEAKVAGGSIGSIIGGIIGGFAGDVGLGKELGGAIGEGVATGGIQGPEAQASTEQSLAKSIGATGSIVESIAEGTEAREQQADPDRNPKAEVTDQTLVPQTLEEKETFKFADVAPQGTGEVDPDVVPQGEGEIDVEVVPQGSLPVGGETSGMGETSGGVKVSKSQAEFLRKLRGTA